MPGLTLRRGGPADAAAHAAEWAAGDGLWLACDGDRVVGALEHAAALARDAGVAVLRVDCWAGAPPLVAYYEGQGFTRSGSFSVGGWRGQVLAMRDP